MMFYLSDGETNLDRIPAHRQTRSAEIVSQVYFDKISKSLGKDGPILQGLVLDIGKIFRSRLFSDLTEPETISFSIIDSEKKPSFPQLDHLLKLGVRESVLQKEKTGTETKPKNLKSVQPEEYLLHRIYSPALSIGFTDRWRTQITCQELSDLVNPDTRSQSLRRTIQKIENQSRKKAPRLDSESLENFGS